MLVKVSEWTCGLLLITAVVSLTISLPWIGYELHQSNILTHDVLNEAPLYPPEPHDEFIFNRHEDDLDKTLEIRVPNIPEVPKHLLER